ncbi:MAG TPA: DUF488 domain-containing protein [Verrucomicrobiae bacterium]|nr:DUF488 domain-containing protein [Verrucomicrobiae bacterium]
MSRKICTIGFGKKSLRKFIELLQRAGVTTLIDARLNNTSQLAGFAKKDDLEYIMELVGTKYIHDISLAPTQELMDGYKEKQINWETFTEKYLALLDERGIDKRVKEIIGEEVPCFLCSEHKPEQCHRSLLAEYIKQHSDMAIQIMHLY